MRNSKSVCLIGASCRAAAQSCKRAQCETIYAWDDFADADLVHIALAKALSDLQSDLQSDLVQSERLERMPLVLCGGIENKPELLRLCIEHGMLCGLSPQALQEIRSVQRWQDWAHQSGIGWPSTLQPPISEAQVSWQSPWVLKPKLGAGGVHVRYIETIAQWLDCVSSIQDTNQWYLQRFIPGVTIGVTYCSDSEKTCLVGVAQALRAEHLDAPSAFIYAGNIAPFRANSGLEMLLLKFGELVAKQTSLVGLWQADFQLDPMGHPWLLEINPRWSASMELHEIGQGVSWMLEHLRVIQGGQIQPELELVAGDWIRPQVACGRSLGKGILYAPSDIHAEATQLDRLWQSRWQGTLGELDRFAFRMADIPQIPVTYGFDAKVAFAAGMPIATVLCTGGDPQQAIHKLQQAKQCVWEWLKIF
jgi:predicted ATP-grasp superfamily ATP-dependent carboligase